MGQPPLGPKRLVDVGVFNVTVPLVLVDVDVLLVLVDIA